jgi:hypothetical protein
LCDRFLAFVPFCRVPSVRITLIDRDVPSCFQSLEHLLRYCARPPFALERLSIRRGKDGRITYVRYVLPCHKAANWVGPAAIAWAKLMARVGEEFPLECPACGGDIRLIAFITEPGPIRKILTHLGEPLEPPPVFPARGPPTDWGELVQVHFRPGNLSGVARRAARDRHPQPLTACHATVRTGLSIITEKARATRV